MRRLVSVGRAILRVCSKNESDGTDPAIEAATSRPQIFLRHAFHGVTPCVPQSVKSPVRGERALVALRPPKVWKALSLPV